LQSALAATDELSDLMLAESRSSPLGTEIRSHVFHAESTHFSLPPFQFDHWFETFTPKQIRFKTLFTANMKVTYLLVNHIFKILLKILGT